MTIEKYWEEKKEWQPKDMWDKSEKRFDYIDMLDFAEQYAKYLEVSEIPYEIPHDNSSDKKLKPEDILPYIPYGVHYGMEYKDIGSLSDTVIYKGTITCRGTEHNVVKIFDYDYKPILTPLSVFFEGSPFRQDSWCQLLHVGNMDFDALKGYRYTRVSFGTTQKLYEYHIDFKGLIDKGLAIDGTKVPDFEIKKPKQENYG